MDDSTFLQQFEAASIPSNRWTHRAHIRMAFLYLRDHPFDEALVRIRSGIQKLNQANGVTDGPMLGYHETVTVAWATIVRSAIEVHGAFPTFDQFAAHTPYLLAKSLLRRHYSPAHIFSPRAKAHFVEPTDWIAGDAFSPS